MDEMGRDIEAVRTVLARLPHAIDAKHWDEASSLFAAEVETDYTSLFGGPAQTQSAEALVGGWRDLLGTVATQHLLGPATVSIGESAARAACHVRAFHRREGAPGGTDWEVLGHYRFQLAREPGGWKITHLALDTLLQTGNRDLLTGQGGEAS